MLKCVMTLLVQVGWSSVKEYYTYTWALVPEGYAEGAAVNCCVLFPGKNEAIHLAKQTIHYPVWLKVGSSCNHTTCDVTV